MKKEYDYIIGIDPDVDKSGVAMLEVKTGSMSLYSMAFPELIRWLQEQDEAMCEDTKRRLVVVEASWKVQANWHGRYGDSRRISARKGYDVGCNHETGRKIVEVVQSTLLEVKEKYPLRKIWKGKGGKITHEELVSLLDGSLIAYGFTRTNQEASDAALLAREASGVSMRMKGGRRGTTGMEILWK